jgi:hypothetical protein
MSDSVYLCRKSSGLKTGENAIVQLAKDSHHGVVCVIRGRIKNDFSIKSATYIFDS